MSELLSVRDLTVEFATDLGVARVLDRISLSIAPGEVVGLVGESGCGKTTLARTILGILSLGGGSIRGGSILFKGRDLLRESSDVVNDDVRGREITFIPQDPWNSLSPLFPVGTQIMDLMKWKSPRRRQSSTSARSCGADGGAAPLPRQDREGPVTAPVEERKGDWPALRRWPALFRGYPRGRRRADRAAVLDILRAARIPEPERALGRLPHEFSGGQRQRLMIAMALLPRPDLIIADEPTTALDVTIQAQILRLLRALVKERGVSVLFTTHDLGTAHAICDRVVVMYAGQEMEAAPTEGFFHRPAHPYTRRLLDSLPAASGEIREIPGEVPSLIEPPTGCRFHPRCDFATPECRERRPDARFVAAGHRVWCYHPVDAP
jgi:peptide/nickel transport system ATP-binding protein